MWNRIKNWLMFPFNSPGASERMEQYRKEIIEAFAQGDFEKAAWLQEEMNR